MFRRKGFQYALCCFSISLSALFKIRGFALAILLNSVFQRILAPLLFIAYSRSRLILFFLASLLLNAIRLYIVSNIFNKLSELVSGHKFDIRPSLQGAGKYLTQISQGPVTVPFINESHVIDPVTANNGRLI